MGSNVIGCDEKLIASLGQNERALVGCSTVVLLADMSRLLIFRFDLGTLLTLGVPLIEFSLPELVAGAAVVVRGKANGGDGVSTGFDGLDTIRMV